MASFKLAFDIGCPCRSIVGFANQTLKHSLNRQVFHRNNVRIFRVFRPQVSLAVFYDKCFWGCFFRQYMRPQFDRAVPLLRIQELPYPPSQICRPIIESPSTRKAEVFRVGVKPRLLISTVMQPSASCSRVCGVPAGIAPKNGDIGQPAAHLASGEVIRRERALRGSLAMTPFFRMKRKCPVTALGLTETEVRGDFLAKMARCRAPAAISG